MYEFLRDYLEFRIGRIKKQAKSGSRNEALPRRRAGTEEERKMSKITEAHPILPCLNWDETIAFYEKLGFAVGSLYPDQYLIMHRNGIQIHFWKSNDRKLAEASGCYIRCQDADLLRTEFLERGIKCTPSEDRSWGVREFQVLDSNGNLLRIGGPLKTEQM